MTDFVENNEGDIMADLENLLSNRLGGVSIFVHDPCPVYRQVCRFKKHRKKKNWTARINVFSHYSDLLRDGDVIHDRVNNAMYMNRKTYNELLKAV